jgi:putative transposase
MKARRYELTDQQQARTSLLMTGTASDPGRTGSDNRLFVDGVWSSPKKLMTPMIDAG